MPRRWILPGLSLVFTFLVLGCSTPQPHGAGESHPPAILKRVQALYPFEMKRQGQIGFATIEYVIDRKGNVTAAKVVEANRPEFGQAALDAISQCKFSPGIKNGDPVDVRVQQTLTFSLSDENPSTSE